MLKRKSLWVLTFLTMVCLKTQASSSFNRYVAYLEGINTFGCTSFEPVERPVYGHPGGVPIGKLSLQNAEYAFNLSKDCTYKPNIVYKNNNSHVDLPLEVFVLNKDSWLLRVYEKLEFNKNSWVKLKAKNSFIWIPVLSRDSVLDVTLTYASGVHLVEEICEENLFCKEASPSFKNETYKAGLHNEKNCYPVTYRIKNEINLRSGIRAYELILAEGVRLEYRNKLPLTLTVPVINKKGSWSAFYADPNCEAFNGDLIQVNN